MPLPDLLSRAILFFFIPLWLLVGFGDWLFHRKTQISETSGTGESLLHLLMLGEVGLPMLAGLFLEINALVLALMIAGFLAHEATVLWDLRYTANKRAILPGEQVIHSYQEAIPLMLLVLVAILHWDQFMALITFSGQADFRLAWRSNPLPAAYLAGILVAAALLVVLPFIEELWRCYRQAAARRIATTLP